MYYYYFNIINLFTITLRTYEQKFQNHSQITDVTSFNILIIGIYHHSKVLVKNYLLKLQYFAFKGL